MTINDEPIFLLNSLNHELMFPFYTTTNNIFRHRRQQLIREYININSPYTFSHNFSKENSLAFIAQENITFLASSQIPIKRYITTFLVTVNGNCTYDEWNVYQCQVHSYVTPGNERTEYQLSKSLSMRILNTTTKGGGI